MYLSTQPADHIHLSEVDSTNRWLLASELPSGTICTADRQNQGRGRRGRSWQTVSHDALIFSGLLIADSSILNRNSGLLSLLCGLALKQSIADFFKSNHIQTPDNVKLLVKWPNDLICLNEGKAQKLAGILIESQTTQNEIRLVIGIGLNWRSAPGQIEDAQMPAAALLDCNDCSGVDDQANVLLAFLIQALNSNLALYYQSKDTEIIRQLKEVLWPLHQTVMLDGQKYRICNLNPDGSLLAIGPEQQQRRLSDSNTQFEVMMQ